MQYEVRCIVVFLATMLLGMPTIVTLGMKMEMYMIRAGYDPMGACLGTIAVAGPIAGLMAFVLVRYAGFFNPSNGAF